MSVIPSELEARFNKAVSDFVANSRRHQKPTVLYLGYQELSFLLRIPTPLRGTRPTYQGMTVYMVDQANYLAVGD